MRDMLAVPFKILIISYVYKYAKAEILRLKCETYANFSVIYENRRQNSSTFRTIFATDKSACQFECSVEPKCKSINVNIDEEICELNDKSASDPLDRAVTISSLGWRFYSPSYEERLVRYLTNWKVSYFEWHENLRYSSIKNFFFK